jgi:hypothetical protein
MILNGERRRREWIKELFTFLFSLTKSQNGFVINTQRPPGIKRIMWWRQCPWRSSTYFLQGHTCTHRDTLWTELSDGHIFLHRGPSRPGLLHGLLCCHVGYTISSVLASSGYYNKIPEIMNLYRKKNVSVGSEFWKLQSMISWPVGGSTWRWDTKGKEEEGGHP